MTARKATPKAAAPVAILVALLCAAAPAPPAEKKPASPQPRPAGARARAFPGDALDVMFVGGNNRPVRVRLRIHVDGEPFAERQDRVFRKVFDFCDRDGDGSLSRIEAQTAAQFAGVMQEPRPGQPDAAAAPDQMMMAARARAESPMDDNRDGKVSPEEFSAYCRKRLGGRAVLLPAPGESPRLASGADAVFQVLDANHDGKLTADEVSKLDLAHFDSDGDELLTAAELTELLPGVNPAGTYNSALQRRMMMQRAQSPGRPSADAGEYGVLLITREMDPEGELVDQAVALEVVRLFSKGKQLAIDRKSLGLEKAAFARIDSDGDGALDVDELLEWLESEPDVEVAINLGKGGDGKAAPSAAVAKGPAGALAATVKLGPPPTVKAAPATRPATGPAAPELADPTSVVLWTGDAMLDLRAAASTTAATDSAKLIESLRELFRTADGEKKGYVDRETLPKDKRSQEILQYFPHADRDQDGRLTEQELVAYGQLQADVGQAGMTFTVAASGRGVLEAMDAGGDGKLSRRELATAWSRLAAFDVDDDGALDRNELPRQYRLVAAAGRDAPAAEGVIRRPRFARGPVNVASAPPSGRGPAWFRKMDANADGDVSPREFLGPPEAFRKLDADGDGLISPEEAEASAAGNAAAARKD
jgi:Ca2+-binding EF-hand superfamily protein